MQMVPKAGVFTEETRFKVVPKSSLFYHCGKKNDDYEMVVSIDPTAPFRMYRLGSVQPSHLSFSTH